MICPKIDEIGTSFGSARLYFSFFKIQIQNPLIPITTSRISSLSPPSSNISSMPSPVPFSRSLPFLQQWANDCCRGNCLHASDDDEQYQDSGSDQEEDDASSAKSSTKSNSKIRKWIQTRSQFVFTRSLTTASNPNPIQPNRMVDKVRRPPPSN